jgi:hypothetical protein
MVITLASSFWANFWLETATARRGKIIMNVAGQTPVLVL